MKPHHKIAIGKVKMNGSGTFNLFLMHTLLATHFVDCYESETLSVTFAFDTKIDRYAKCAITILLFV